MSDVPEGLLDKYRRWAANNTSLIQDVEILLRGLSYILSGYIKESVVLSEFIYSTAQLISLIHTRILRRDVCVPSAFVVLLEDFLRILKIVEIFLESAALRLGGSQARWLILISIQIVKAVLKLVILNRTGEITKPLDQERRNYNQEQQISGGQYYTLPGSGRTIRTTQSAPPIYQRSWQPPPLAKNRQLDSSKMIGEVIYLVKPVLHLAAVGKCGEQAWLPFFLAIGLDFTSQSLLGSKNVSREHREEILRRWFTMANYCLRSPFYDKKSKYVILGFLRCVERCLPIGGGLVGNLREFIEEYQTIYGYVWQS